jgi:hypothetical protein
VQVFCPDSAWGTGREKAKEAKIATAEAEGAPCSAAARRLTCTPSFDTQFGESDPHAQAAICRAEAPYPRHCPDGMLDGICEYDTVSSRRCSHARSSGSADRPDDRCRPLDKR